MRITLIGAALIAVGLLLHPILPINKKLWTSGSAIFIGLRIAPRLYVKA